jgi:hypothetical protein
VAEATWTTHTMGNLAAGLRDGVASARRQAQDKRSRHHPR